MFNRVISGNKKSQMYVFSVILVAFVATPFLAFSSRHGDLYVNAKASGMEDGSKDHPYEKIGSAIDKANSNDEIHVAKGEYKENITLKKGMKLFGEDKDNTIIKAKKDKWSTVYMEDNSEIDGFTIEDGDRGIWIGKHAKASVIDCIVKNNDGDGIGVEGGDVAKANQVYIGKTTVRKNGRAGIYVAGSRKISIMDSEILENDSDGIDLARGTSAYLENNLIKNNDGSGLVATIDNSNIWTKSNSFRENKRAGLEVSSFGGTGRINVAKGKFVGNDRYAVTRLQKAGSAISASSWSTNLTFDKNAYFSGNGFGNISNILRSN